MWVGGWVGGWVYSWRLNPKANPELALPAAPTLVFGCGYLFFARLHG